MKLKNFEFLQSPTGGVDIYVRQSADDSQVIASLHINEEDLYALLASLDLVADLDDEDLDDLDFEDDEVESEDSEDEEEA